MAFSNEFLPKRLVIVDLAVEHNPERTVFVAHRLCAALRKINDRKTAVCQSDAAVGGDPFTQPVRSATGHVVTNSKKFIPVNSLRDRMICEDRRYTAHIGRRTGLKAAWLCLRRIRMQLPRDGGLLRNSSMKLTGPSTLVSM